MSSNLWDIICNEGSLCIREGTIMWQYLLIILFLLFPVLVL